MKLKKTPLHMPRGSRNFFKFVFYAEDSTGPYTFVYPKGERGNKNSLCPSNMRVKQPFFHLKGKGRSKNNLFKNISIGLAFRDAQIDDSITSYKHK